MIEKLTKTQIARFPEFIEKWLQIGLSTEPANREQAKKGLLELFSIAKIKQPKIFIWLDSPLQGTIAKNIILGLQVDSQVRSQVSAQVHSIYSQVTSQVASQVAEPVHSIASQIASQVGSQVRSVGSQIDSQIRSIVSQIDSQVVSQVGLKIHSQIRSQIASISSQVAFCYTADYGLHQAGWLSFYDYFYQAIGMDFIDKFSGYFEIAKSCGWIYDVTIKEIGDIIIFTERPCKLIRDNNFRLNADGEKALEYPDGFGIYASHGIRLTEKYGKVKQAQWEAKWILEEKNAELRRVLIQNIGYGKICRDLNAKQLDSWREYELLQIDNVDIEPIKLLKMVCPSMQLIHAHRVPPDIKNARQAIQWINHGIDAEEFVMER